MADKEPISENSTLRLSLVIVIITAVAGAAYWVGSRAHINDSIKDLNTTIKDLSTSFQDFLLQRAAFEAEYRVRMEALERGQGLRN